MPKAKKNEFYKLDTMDRLRSLDMKGKSKGLSILLEQVFEMLKGKRPLDKKTMRWYLTFLRKDLKSLSFFTKNNQEDIELIAKTRAEIKRVNQANETSIGEIMMIGNERDKEFLLKLASLCEEYGVGVDYTKLHDGRTVFVGHTAFAAAQVQVACGLNKK